MRRRMSSNRRMAVATKAIGVLSYRPGLHSFFGTYPWRERGAPANELRNMGLWWPRAMIICRFSRRSKRGPLGRHRASRIIHSEPVRPDTRVGVLPVATKLEQLGDTWHFGTNEVLRGAELAFV